MHLTRRLLRLGCSTPKQMSNCVRRYASGGVVQAKMTEDGKNELEADRVVVAVDEAKSFITRCIVKAGINACHAEQMADVLVTGDYRGHFSHGLNRLGGFCVLVWPILWIEFSCA